MMTLIQKAALLKLTGRSLTWSLIKHCSSVKPKYIRKAKSNRKASSHFDDFKRTKVLGGKGGDGKLSFASIAFKEFAGPDGGDGGNGGHVIFEATTNKNSLSHLRSQYKAEDGINGTVKCCHGSDADHLKVQVPLGTLFKSPEGDLLADLKKEGDIFVAARGGAGGHGNHFFLSNENRAPMVYEEGGKPEEKKVLVELRVMAHIGLVGFPNAGKSTLLRSISRAKPKVAAYPFTTLRPHVGIVEYEDYEQIAVADIPGLIKGAHMNFGLGFDFLRHIERCLCLLYVLDLSVAQPWQQFEDLQYELEQYKPGLSKRPHAVVANKVDLPQARENLNELQKKTDHIIFPISAKQKVNTRELLVYLRKLYDQHLEKE